MYCSKLSLSFYLSGLYSPAIHWLCGILNSCLTCCPCWATWVTKMIMSMRMTAMMMEMVTMIISVLVYLYFFVYLYLYFVYGRKKTNLGDCGSDRPLPTTQRWANNSVFEYYSNNIQIPNYSLTSGIKACKGTLLCSKTKYKGIQKDNLFPESPNRVYFLLVPTQYVPSVVEWMIKSLQKVKVRVKTSHLIFG